MLTITATTKSSAVLISEEPSMTMKIIWIEMDTGYNAPAMCLKLRFSFVLSYSFLIKLQLRSGIYSILEYKAIIICQNAITVTQIIVKLKKDNQYLKAVNVSLLNTIMSINTVLLWLLS